MSNILTNKVEQLLKRELLSNGLPSLSIPKLKALLPKDIDGFELRDSLMELIAEGTIEVEGSHKITMRSK